MAKISELNTIWRNIREIDLQSFRDEALHEIRIAVVGVPGSGRHALADHLRQDPVRTDMLTQTPVLILDINEVDRPFTADLIVIMVDAQRQEYRREMELTSQWINQGKKVLVFVNQTENASPSRRLDLPASHHIAGSVDDTHFLQRTFAPIVMEFLPDRLLSLGRKFPLFRVPIAHHLINETCFANAIYALGTGLAEVVPVLNLPLTVADMVVLTKSQAFLAYKLGLAFGFSLEWRDYLSEFGSVVGGGFIWRQLARSLVGLIPVLGIVPKIAVAYSGTFVVGHTILQWYLTGRHLSAAQMKALTVQAFRRGQRSANELVAKVQRPRQKREKTGRKKGKQAAQQLTEGELGDSAAESQLLPASTPTPSPAKKKRLGWGKKDDATLALPTPQKSPPKTSKRWGGKKKKGTTGDGKECSICGRTNAVDAKYCQYCATPLIVSEDIQDNN